MRLLPALGGISPAEEPLLREGKPRRLSSLSSRERLSEAGLAGAFLVAAGALSLLGPPAGLSSCPP